MTEEEERALMMRIRSDDHEAFAELVALYESQILNIIYRYIGRRFDAEDIAQEVFLRVYGARKQYVRTAKLSTWIYRITANVCLNELRDRKKERVGTPDAGVISDEKNIDPTDIQDHREIVELVRSALASLPDAQRLAIILVKYEGLSYAEASQVLAISQKALKSLLFRAKERLRLHLAPVMAKRDRFV